MQEAVPKKEVPRACTSEHGSADCMHALNTMSAVHVHSTRLPPLVDLIPSTLRRDLRSLSEIPSTLRRNLRSIAMSFFLPCEHNNRKADRIGPDRIPPATGSPLLHRYRIMSRNTVVLPLPADPYASTFRNTLPQRFGRSVAVAAGADFPFEWETSSTLEPAARNRFFNSIRSAC